MARLIDADSLIDFLDVGHLRHPSELCFSEVDVANLLLHAPTISPDEARGVGEWIDYQQGRWVYAQCSECETVHDVRSNYCPSCGARMSRAEAEKAMEVSG